MAERAALIARCLTLTVFFLDERDLQALVTVHSFWRDELKDCAFASYDMHNCRLDKLLAYFPNLHQLQLRNSATSPLSFPSFLSEHHFRFASLSALSLHNFFGDRNTTLIFQLPSLKRLELIEYRGTLPVSQLIARCVQCLSLRSLLLSKCHHQGVDAEDLAALVDLLPSLQELHVTECTGLVGLPRLSSSSKPHVSLRALTLSKAPLLFSRSPAFQRPQPPFGRIQASLSGSSWPPYLQHLDVSFTSIMNEDLVSTLRSLPCLRSLLAVQCLNLRRCLHLHLSKNVQLQTLKLKNCQNIEELSVHCVGLASLDLSLCRSLTRLGVSSQALQLLDLSMLSALRSLDLNCPHICRIALIGCRNFLLDENQPEVDSCNSPQAQAVMKQWLRELQASCEHVHSLELLAPANIAGSAVFDFAGSLLHNTSHKT